MLLFRSEEHIERWRSARGRADGATLTLDQQWELAHAWYSDRLDPAWQRRSPAEAQKLLTSLGLTGAFWQLTPP